MSDYPLMEKVTSEGSSTINKLYVYGPTGLIAMNNDDGWFFMTKDHLGSTRAVLNESNTVITYFDYTPFGDIMRSKVETNVDYQFTGQEKDNEISLHNFRARLGVYPALCCGDSELGIFYGMDPAGQGYSPYAYAGNNPIIRVDRDGQFWQFVIGAVIGGIVNTIAHWNKINDFGDGLAAFAIGAGGGAIVAATGGAALAAAGGSITVGAGGFLAGAGSAAVSFGFGSTFTNIGNSIFFNDPYPTLTDQLTNLGVAMLTGGIMNGLAAKANGLGFWTGDPGMPSLPGMPAVNSINQTTNNIKPTQMPKANVGNVLDDGLQNGQGSIRLIPKAEVPVRQSFKLNAEWKNWSKYMLKRGWTYSDIQQTLTLGNSANHIGQNWLNPGNPMIRIINPVTGKSLIIDKITKEIIQLGNVGFKY